MIPQTDKATARPWRNISTTVGTVDKSKTICTTDWKADPDYLDVDLPETIEGAQANAALIVKSVNEYDALCKVAECAVRLAVICSTVQLNRTDMAEALKQLSTLRNGK